MTRISPKFETSADGADKARRFGALAPQCARPAVVALLGMATALPVWAIEVSTATTTPVTTSTANGGAADDVTVTEDGSVDVSGNDGAVAITVDSNNNVAVNGGTLTAEDTNNVTGILVTASATDADITIDGGTISLTEDYTREDQDDDGDLDGALAIGENRSAIFVAAGGALTGDIRIKGDASLEVEGNNSSGVYVDRVLDGTYAQDGTVSVIGDNAQGVQVRDDITGDVLISGSINAQGQNAEGLYIGGDVGGNLTIESSVTSTGFTSAAQTNYIRPNAVNEDTLPVDERLDADDLFDNNFAVSVNGGLSNGLLINGAYDDFVSAEDAADETKDTIEDFDENRTVGNITSYGSGVALGITAQSGEDLVLGAVVETVRDTLDDDGDEDTEEVLATFTYDQGFINRGTVFASGLNVGFDATALRVQGATDGTANVVITGGMLNTGTIEAQAFEADAYAAYLGDGAVIGAFENSGTIEAVTNTLVNNSAVALYIADGASVTSLKNSGTIDASSVGFGAQATGVLDAGDTLREIENTGLIFGRLTSDGRDDLGLGSAVAIDLSGQTLGASILQFERDAVEDINGDGEIDSNDTLNPQLVGDVLFGSGDDSFRILSGIMVGDVSFGAGDAVYELSNASGYGDVTFGGDTFTATLTGAETTTGQASNFALGAAAGAFSITDNSVINGAFTSSANAASFTIADSNVTLLKATDLQLDSLSVSGASQLSFEIDPQNARTTPFMTVANSATIGSGTTLLPILTSIVDEDFSVTLVQAGTLNFGGSLADLQTENLPFIYNVTFSTTDGAVDTLDLNFDIKTADELQLDPNQASALGAVLELAVGDEEVGAAISSLTTQQSFNQAYNLLLPQRTDAATRYLESQSNAAFSALSEHLALTRLSGERANGIWVQENFSSIDTDGSDLTPGYNGRGLGLSVGMDWNLLGLDAVGIMGTMTDGKFEEETGGDNPVNMKSFGLGGYLWERLGPVDLQFAAQYALVNHTSYRDISVGDYRSEVSAEWDGTSQSASFIASSEFGSERFRVTPRIGVDYFALQQDGYEETASNGLNLAVGDADTNKLTASAGLGLAMVWRTGVNRGRYARSIGEGTPSIDTRSAVRAGLDLGYRSTLSSDAFEVDAGYVGYDSTFKLVSQEEYGDAFTAGLSLLAGSDLLKLKLGVGTEISEEATQITASASLKLRF